MTLTVRAARRAGFTLIELMVAMGVIIVLASISLLVIPDVLEQDRTTEGAGRLQQWLNVAKLRAARDGQPRGLRLINNGGFATEAQYIEASPILLPNPNQDNNTESPQVFFDYREHIADATKPKKIYLRFLSPADQAKVGPNTTILLPGLEAIVQVTAVAAETNATYSNIPAGQTWFRVTPSATTGVDPFPDIGLGNQVVAYQFGLYESPQPLLGEPVMQLPTNVAVDVGSSLGVPTTGLDVDLIFYPSGNLVVASGSGQVFLWVRDKTKPNGGNTGHISDLESSGEQLLVTMRARSGSIGVYPIDFATPSDPYTLARKGASGQ